jgi:hypothetical protein
MRMPRAFVERFHTYGVDQPETDRDGNLTEGIQSLFLRRGNSPCGILYLGVGVLNYHGSSRYRNARPVLKAPGVAKPLPGLFRCSDGISSSRAGAGSGEPAIGKFRIGGGWNGLGGQPRKAAIKGTAPPSSPQRFRTVAPRPDSDNGPEWLVLSLRSHIPAQTGRSWRGRHQVRVPPRFVAILVNGTYPTR